MILSIGILALIALLGRNREIGYGWSFVLLLSTGLIGLIIILCSKKKDVDFVDVNNNNQINN